MAKPRLDHSASEDLNRAAGTVFPPLRPVRDVLLLLALVVLVCGIGVFWIDATVPGAWPDAIGPTWP